MAKAEGWCVLNPERPDKTVLQVRLLPLRMGWYTVKDTGQTVNLSPPAG